MLFFLDFNFATCYQGAGLRNDLNEVIRHQLGAILAKLDIGILIFHSQNFSATLKTQV